ncbi:MAG: ribbon-helix-helix protein, CopG family [Desulfatitalea sp.]
MRTIQMTLDDDLVAKVDDISRVLKTSRSAFTRDALREAVRRYQREQLEARHRNAYARYPVSKDEFSVWEDEQAWGDE